MSYNRFNTLDTIFDRWTHPTPFGFGTEWITSKTTESFADRITTKDDGSYLLEVEVPGYAKEDITLSVEGNLLKLVLKREGKAEKNLSYKLSSKVDVTGIKATCKNGILSVDCPLKTSSQAVAITVE